MTEYVFTVPMRNWNFVYNKRVHKRGKRFYSTYEELKLEEICDVLEIQICFYSTYEELKLYIV